MDINLRITLKAARVNAGLKQYEVADQLTKYFGQKVSRQRVAYYENHPEEIPLAYGAAFSKIYHWPQDALKFTN